MFKIKINNSMRGTLFIIAGIAGVVFILFLFFPSLIKFPKSASREVCPTIDLETECFSEQCFADIKCSDELSEIDIGQDVITFENKIPEGFPEDMPIDQSPVEIIKSFTATSYNPPPEDIETTQITYVYLTNKSMAETFNELRDYAVDKDLTIEFEEQGNKLHSFYAAQKPNNDYILNVTIVPEKENLSEKEEKFLVTISILTN